jgi:hypothetical protein
MTHRHLNPYVYHFLQDLGTFDNLAQLLDTPDNWETMYHQVMADRIFLN